MDINILIADNDPDVLGLAEQLLNKEQYTVRTATTGKECMQAIYREKPDLLLLDILLPDTTGTAICQKIKNDPDISSIYIILLSGINIQADQIAEGLNTGAEGYLIKPVNNLEFTARVKAAQRAIIAERTLRESEERYRKLVEQSPDTIVIHCEDKIVYINPAGLSLLGYKGEEEIIGKSAIDFVYPDDRARVGRRIREALSQDQPAPIMEERFIRSDGSVIQVAVKGVPLTYHEKPAMQVIIRDITDRKRSEEVLRESEERFRVLFDEAPLGYHSLDADGHLIDVNQAWLDVLGYSHQEVIGQWFGNFLTLAYRESFQKRFQLFKRLGQIHSEFEMISKSGQVLFISFDGKVGTDVMGNFKQTHCILKDITKERQAEQMVRKLSLGIEQSPAAIVITDHQGHIEYVNPKFTEITGYLLENVKGKTARILKPGKTTEEMHQKLWDNIQSGHTWKGEYLSKRMNGEMYWESVTVSPITDQEGNNSNFIILVEDISENKKMIEELIIAKEKAEQSDRLKSTFLANMSHEIRTPMNAIIGFSGMLSEPGFTEEARNRFTSIIQSRSNELMHIINDLLEISRIESGNASVKKTTISLNSMLDELEVVFAQKAARTKKPVLALYVEKNLSDEQSLVFTDDYLLNQVFNNLIDNAIKYTESGSVRFGYHTPAEGMITCFVTDTGIGILKENFQVIFEHFRQADIPDPHKYGGTGLGLSICRGSVALLGGEIWVESEPGIGSTFFFRIPFEKEAINSGPGYKPLQEPTRDDCNWSGKKILLVEDDQTNMEFLQVILAPTGAELVTVINSSQLRAMYNRLDFLDMILMDIRLPDAIGWDLVKEIKTIRPGLPVIAQTAYAMSSDRLKSEEAGCDGYISKPINKTTLLGLISKYI